MLCKRYISLGLLALVLLVLGACANRAMGPQGGPKDLTPPRFLEAKPAKGQLQVTDKELELEFDEFINLDKPGDKIIVSPPQSLPPTIRTSGKKVLVTLNDSLQPNTTYSIDFTNSIVDITERNPLEAFTYSFSTGNTIDSLQISGTVLDAENLNPLANMQVGIYDNLNDSAFIKTAPLRVARTNDAGYFSIKSVRAGSYHIFALNDLNRDFCYNDPNEQMAFFGELVVPRIENVLLLDTIKKDSIPIKINKKIYLPDSLVLLAFKEKVWKQYFIKAERKEPYKLTFFFNAPNKKLPELSPLNFNANVHKLMQVNATADTITYWISDSTVYMQDTLKFTLSYEKADSTGVVESKVDTVSLHYKKPPTGKKNKGSKVIEKKLFTMNSSIKGDIDLNKPIVFEFNLPVAKIDSHKIHLSYKVDTLYKEIPIKLEMMDSLGFKFIIRHNWDSELAYKMDVDSGAFTSLYGYVNLKSSISFKAKNLDQYAKLIVLLSQFDSLAVLELLDSKELVLQSIPAKDAGTEFEYLNPGDYYLRLYIDSNRNKHWDAGKYAEKKQAEQVYYYPQKISLRANWDVEQEWDFKLIPLILQKPIELKKKPK